MSPGTISDRSANIQREGITSHFMTISSKEIWWLCKIWTEMGIEHGCLSSLPHPLNEWLSSSGNAPTTLDKREVGAGVRKVFLQEVTKHQKWWQWGLSKKGWEVLRWKAATPLPSWRARNVFVCWVCGRAALPPHQRAHVRGCKGQLQKPPRSLPHYLWSYKVAGVAVLLLEQMASYQNGTSPGQVVHHERPLNKGISHALWCYSVNN